jgi:hypothetical protein
MSGGGDTGGDFGGGRGRDAPYDCSRLRFEATLASPDATVAATLHVGDILDVILETAPVRRVVVSVSGTVAGSLVDHLAQLIACLQERAFRAEVLSVAGRVVRVRVEPA